MVRHLVLRAAGVVAFAVFVTAAAACGGFEADVGGSGSSDDRPGNVSVDVPPQSGPQSDATSERKVVINSAIAVEVEKLGEAYTRVSSIARQAGGFVAESSIVGDMERGSASLRLRVPAAEHDAVVAQLRELGVRVKGESTSSKEVTEEYTDLEARVRNLQRTEAQYQQFMAQAKTLDEVLNVSNRLESVRGQIEQTQGRMRLLDNLDEFATISVGLAVAARPAPKAERPTPLEVFVSAGETSIAVALALANVLAALAVVFIWVLLLAPVSAVGLRYGRRLAPVARRIIDW